MKLLSITNRYYLISLLLFFIFAGVVLFHTIRLNLNGELDEQLRTEQLHFMNTIQPMDSLNTSSMSLFGNFSVRRVSDEVHLMPVIFDSLLYDEAEKENIPFRLIQFSAQTKSANYVFVMKESKIETTDLVYSIFISLMSVFGLFCVILFISNSFLSKKIWSPFLETISAIKTLNINDRDVSFKYQTSRIDELNELNASLQKMIERIKSDFLRMKEFSENAAHELQTPLSIIRSKLESLLQSKSLNDEDAQLIDQALESTVRLSRLNQSLLLLTKIENRQYEQKQMVDFSLVFEKYIELYAEIIAEKEMHIQLNKEEKFIFEINPMLTDILVSNLLSNAIKHNIRSGEVVINLKKGRFEIANTGDVPDCSTELFFNRFKKGDHSPEHLGLGLALVKEIVETCDLKISYTFEHERHLVVVRK